MVLGVPDVSYTVRMARTDKKVGYSPTGKLDDVTPDRHTRDPTQPTGETKSAVTSRRAIATTFGSPVGRSARWMASAVVASAASARLAGALLRGGGAGARAARDGRAEAAGSGEVAARASCLWCLARAFRFADLLNFPLPTG